MAGAWELFDGTARSEDVAPADPAAGGHAPLDRLVALLDRLAGAGAGRDLLRQLLLSVEEPEAIARTIAASAAFATLYKEARTLNIGLAGPKDADAAFVGLPTLPAGLAFEELFERHFRPRLGKRAEGFAAIFAALGPPRRDLLVVETGCMRVPCNWEGDGQSTFMFDAFARDRQGLFFSVDITLESIETARRACSSATHLLLGDSVATLHALARAMPARASLLYLDSYDLDPANPMPSAIHHAMELAAARTLIGPGTIVAVDDYGIAAGGKGLILDQFFGSIRAEVIYSGYQKVWRMP
jgi:hypothetical protein